MNNNEQIIISLDSRHAANIFNGTKKVELRRRKMNIKAGTIAWIYVKLPVGSVVGSVRIESIYCAAPATIWKRYGLVSGINRKEYFEYYSDVSRGTALLLKDAKLLNDSISLSELRDVSEGFHPPQFFARLYERDPLFDAILSCS